MRYFSHKIYSILFVISILCFNLYLLHSQESQPRNNLPSFNESWPSHETIFYDYSDHPPLSLDEGQPNASSTTLPKVNNKKEDDPKEKKPSEEQKPSDPKKEVGNPDGKKEKTLSTTIENKKEEKPKKVEISKKDDKPKEPAFLVPLSMGHCGYIMFKPGIRIQPRYNYEPKDRFFNADYYADNYGYGYDAFGPQRRHEHDFFIRRFRIKGSGEAFQLAKYLVEFKIDNIGRFNIDPKAEVENAWLDFTLCKYLAYVRVGLYDLPFSRDALTSDAKLLFMDRTLIKEKLTEFGLADNTIGILLHGRPYAGRFEYYVGIFDNIKFDRLGFNSRDLMPAGRLVVNFLDPQEPPDGYADYEESYIGKGTRLAIAVNAAYLGGIKDDFEEIKKRKRFAIAAWGTDFFFNYYEFTFQAEYDWYQEHKKYGYGWYLQTAYLFALCAELAVRFQELVPTDRKEKEQWTSIGINTYFRQHNLKTQADYTFKRKPKLDRDDEHVFEIQLQLDF